ncbi:MAG TPA: (d)CMP kinase [Chlamydiales bacterium]|nr:(d)CMP kinase [Chlamydiales bacterium]HPE84612.1 (d)CMP kinase [Chlamydiales bacterium]
MIITIDGPSGTGKSTVARKLAERLKFNYLDSGAMYRALAFQMLSQGIKFTDLEAIEALCERFSFHSRSEDGVWRYYLGQTEVTDEIRKADVTALSSQIAAYPFVRKAMAALQRRQGETSHLVCEGRDIGTVIFPDAELKIFLTATPDIRAKRRYEEMKRKFPDEHFDLEEIKNTIILRDSADVNRTIAPLKQPEDAFVIDTSYMDIDEVVASIVNKVTS